MHKNKLTNGNKKSMNSSEEQGARREEITPWGLSNGYTSDNLEVPLSDGRSKNTSTHHKLYGSLTTKT